VKLVAVSYDSPAILKEFAQRHGIEFPLVGDPDGKILRQFGVLNAEATGMNKGMAHPGFFYLDATGVIREKYFEVKDTDRYTANNVMGRLFPELGEEVSANVDAPHLKLTLEQSDQQAIAGSRVSLIAEIELQPGVHVYAPGVQGYKPIALVLKDAGGLDFEPAVYPNPKILYLPAIQEHVPVFEGKFRVTQDATVDVSKTRELFHSVLASERKIKIEGELKYQACDEKVCYPPATVPVTWTLEVLPLDLKRSPEDIRHK
jgi:hypothetical protein